jgi:hypothetical protein
MKKPAPPRSGSKPTPRALYEHIKAEALKLTAKKQRELRALLMADPLFGNEAGWALMDATMTAMHFQRQNSKRSRPEDKSRNDAIRADHAIGLSYAKIAQKLDTTVATVRGVLRRSRKARAA